MRKNQLWGRGTGSRLTRAWLKLPDGVCGGAASANRVAGQNFSSVGDMEGYVSQQALFFLTNNGWRAALPPSTTRPILVHTSIVEKKKGIHRQEDVPASCETVRAIGMHRIGGSLDPPAPHDVRHPLLHGTPCPEGQGTIHRWARVEFSMANHEKGSSRSLRLSRYRYLMPARCDAVQFHNAVNNAVQSPYRETSGVFAPLQSPSKNRLELFWRAGTAFWSRRLGRVRPAW